MAARRLGGGGAGGKLAAITAAVAVGMDSVTRQLERPIDRSRGVFERVALESVRPDSDNPRSLRLTWEELQRGVIELQDESIPRTKRSRIYEAILEKSNSFKKIGQIQAIATYRDDRAMLRIIDGEQRYWAARLAGWTEIEAKIRPTRPRYLRVEQYAANALRDDLDLAGLLNNLEMILEEAEEDGTPIKSLNDLAEALSRPRTTVQYWWAILRGQHDDVKAAIRDGSVTSLETAYTAAQEPDPGRRAALLQGHAVPARNATPKPESRNSTRGRRKTTVELGRVGDLETIRRLIEAVPLEQRFENTNWGDPKSVQKTWKEFLTAFTRLVKKSGASPAQG
jgi:hypothetical protein